MSAPRDNDLERNLSLSAGTKWTDRRSRLVVVALRCWMDEDENWRGPPRPWGGVPRSLSLRRVVGSRRAMRAWKFIMMTIN